MKDMMAIVFRHLTTILIVIALSWTIAKPHAEEFVRKTVNERLTKIETNMDQQEVLLQTIIRKLDIMQNRNSQWERRTK